MTMPISSSTEVDFYTRFYAAVANSRANARYAERVYGRNLCQHGFADMADLDQIIRITGLDSAARLLDLGCGNGMISEYISDRTGAHTTGIDLIPAAIQQALERTESKRQRLQFHVMDISQLDFNPAEFSVLISIDSLYFTPLQDSLQGMLRILKPGGCMAIFFDQGCLPWEPLESFPKETTRPHGTDLARALQALNLPYEIWDYSQAMYEHARRRLPALAELKDEFVAEETLFLYERHLGEAKGLMRAYENGALGRYLYRVVIES